MTAGHHVAVLDEDFDDKLVASISHVEPFDDRENVVKLIVGSAGLLVDWDHKSKANGPQWSSLRVSEQMGSQESSL